MSRKAAFAPVADASVRVMILGSLPGEASLAAGQYYANPRNGFWQLIGCVIGLPDLPSRAYPARLAALAAAGIGLWDAVASASRSGSLDSAIRAAAPAPLADFMATLPQLRAVAFNGAKAAKLGRNALASAPYALIDLPSSSPAHAAMPLAEKQRRWLALHEFLA